MQCGPRGEDRVREEQISPVKPYSLADESVGAPGSLRPVTSNDEFWNDPRKYREVAAHIQHLEAMRLLALLPQEQREAIRTVLDIGSGDGSFTLDHLATALPNATIVGIDRSRPMVEGASSLLVAAPSSSKERVHFILGDITDSSGAWREQLRDLLGVGEGRVDLVFTNSALHHIYDSKAFWETFSTIRELLIGDASSAPGLLLASFAGAGNFDRLIACADQVKALPEWSSYFDGWSGYPLLRPDVEQVRERLSHAGFDIESAEIKLAEVTLILESSDQLFRFCRGCLRSFGGHLGAELTKAGLSESQRDQALDRFFAAVANLYVTDMAVADSVKIPFPEKNIEMKVRPVAQVRAVPVGSFGDGMDLSIPADELKLIRFLEQVSKMPAVVGYREKKSDLLGVRPGMTVLDAGCGVGSDTAWIAEQLNGAGRVIGIDRSQSRIDYARRALANQLTPEHFATVEVTAGDLAALTSIPSDSVDTVLSERVQIHIPPDKQQLVLQELYRALKPGGRIVLVEPDFHGVCFDSDDANLTQQIVLARANEIKNPQAGSTLAAALSGAGFSDIKIEKMDLQHRYQDSKLLDLNDIEAALGTEGYPAAALVKSWLAEQAQREAEGRFRAITPMYFAVGFKSL